MKNLKKRILAIVLFATILASVPYEINYNIESTANSFSIENSTVYAATKTITVTKADEKTVKSIHEQLASGKALNLKVKGNASESKTLVGKLNSKIKKVNKQGVVFQYTKGKTASGYTTYSISADQAGTYQYAVKFIKKLYGNVRDGLSSNENYINFFEDYSNYPKENTRKLRWAYDCVVKNGYMGYIGLNNGEWISFVPDTYDTVKTKSNVWLNGYSFYDPNGINEQLIKKIVYQYTFQPYAFDEYNDYFDLDERVFCFDEEKSEEELNQIGTSIVQELSEAGYLCPNVYYYSGKAAYGYSFEEFCNLPVAQTLADKVVTYYTPKESAVILYKTKNFCDLSDAMKVFAIAQSGYFFCNYDRPKYGMIYVYTWQKYYGKAGMKKLYDNKAEGVCEVYAAYENEVWKSLGFKSYINSNYNISHAWSVVAVKNSKGKTLWIPFDYGLGPAEGLAVTEDVRNKYLKTEAMRYKLYLNGIKGAPTKKNFKDSDFN